MKSENDLKITGTVVSDVNLTSGQSSTRFRIAHNFGGGKKPLFLDCVQIIKPGTDPEIPRKGDCVRVRAYLQMHGESIEAVVKSFVVMP